MSIPSEFTTLRDFVRYAASLFQEKGIYLGHGTDHVWDEAITLVLHTLHLPLSTPPHVLDAHLTQAEKQTIYARIQTRVEKRIPLAYLTNEAWFSNLAFYVDERVLIPRSPIAELIENRFQPWIDPDQVHHILDLCTGSACIAIACAKLFPEADIHACDLSQDALAVANINRLRHHVQDQVQLFQGDLWDALPSGQTYDIIVSNPPYVNWQDMQALPPEYHHEPSLGLRAGEDGLDIVHRIIEQAKSRLTPQGILIVEVGNSEAALLDHYPNLPFIFPEFERAQSGGVFILHAHDLPEEK